jgi:hypothetical protein
MYTHSPDPSKQYAILRKICGSRDQAIPGYFAPQEQIPWVRGCYTIWINPPPQKKYGSVLPQPLFPPPGKLFALTALVPSCKQTKQ